MIRFEVPGDPVPKARARVVINKGRVHAFTPEQTRTFETKVRIAAIKAMHGKHMMRGAVDAEIEIGVRRPKKCIKRVPIGRPDLDNLLKAVIDGCNGIVFADDAQIVHLVATKYYDDQPGIRAVFYDGDG
jgi:Holliday junction resolvase RusA-like endonuclease